jgi:hypothetical protein
LLKASDLAWGYFLYLSPLENSDWRDASISFTCVESGIALSSQLMDELAIVAGFFGVIQSDWFMDMNFPANRQD